MGKINKVHAKMLPIVIDDWIYEIVDPITGQKVMVKDIVGYEGYAVSNDGRLWMPFRKKFTRGYPNNKNACQVCLRTAPGEKSKRFLLSRLVAMAWVPNPDDLPEVNHLDEDRSNARPGNLAWSTHKANMEYSRPRIYGSKMKRALRAQRGKVYITNGKTRKLVAPDAPIPEGWHRTARIRQMRITNGKIIKMIQKSQPIPDGWQKVPKGLRITKNGFVGMPVYINNGKESKAQSRFEPTPKGWKVGRLEHGQAMAWWWTKKTPEEKAAIFRKKRKTENMRKAT